jgi:hypothetical protein
MMARRLGIAVQGRRFGQQPFALVVARRFLGHVVENLLRFGVFALRHADVGLEVGGIEEVGVLATTRSISLRASLNLFWRCRERATPARAQGNS